MPDFKKNFRSGGARPYSRDSKPFGRSGSFEKKELFNVECNKCHKPTQVPFRPNGKKPVYCKDCFVPDTDREQKPRFERRAFPTRAEHAPRIEKDPRIDDVIHRLDSIERTLEKLNGLLEETIRKEALATEIRKHMPVEKVATKRKAATKKLA